MGVSERRRAGVRSVFAKRRLVRHGVALLALALVAGLVVLAVLRLNLHRTGHALVTASPGWIVLALFLMGSSLVLRSISWHGTLRAALPTTPIGWPPVVRATMIGVMASAVFPGRIGEPARVVVLSRRLDGPTRRHLPIVAGTVFSQTLINLLALGILLAVTFTSVPLLHGHVAGIIGALAVPLALCLLVLAGPRLLVLAHRSRWHRLRAAATVVERLLRLARQGLAVFARPRHGSIAVGAQLMAWALQWLACYSVLLALGLQHEAGLVAAAAILLAVNVSAVVPATPSNIGVFQAACVVVLAAFGVGTSAGVAYGILLQAVEVVTALAMGVPALLGEGLRLRDLRAAGEERSAGDGASAGGVVPGSASVPGPEPSAGPER